MQGLSGCLEGTAPCPRLLPTLLFSPSFIFSASSAKRDPAGGRPFGLLLGHPSRRAERRAQRSTGRRGCWVGVVLLLHLQVLLQNVVFWGETSWLTHSHGVRGALQNSSGCPFGQRTFLAFLAFLAFFFFFPPEEILPNKHILKPAAGISTSHRSRTLTGPLTSGTSSKPFGA